MQSNPSENINMKPIFSHKEFFSVKLKPISLMIKRYYISILSSNLCTIVIPIKENYKDKYSKITYNKGQNKSMRGFILEIEIKTSEKRLFIITLNHLLPKDLLLKTTNFDIVFESGIKKSIEFNLENRFVLTKEAEDITAIELKANEHITSECLGYDFGYSFSALSPENKTDTSNLGSIAYFNEGKINLGRAMIIGESGDSYYYSCSLGNEIQLEGCPVLGIDNIKPKVIGIHRAKYEKIKDKENKFYICSKINGIYESIKINFLRKKSIVDREREKNFKKSQTSVNVTVSMNKNMLSDVKEIINSKNSNLEKKEHIGSEFNGAKKNPINNNKDDQNKSKNLKKDLKPVSTQIMSKKGTVPSIDSQNILKVTTSSSLFKDTKKISQNNAPIIQDKEKEKEKDKEKEKEKEKVDLVRQEKEKLLIQKFNQTFPNKFGNILGIVEAKFIPEKKLKVENNTSTEFRIFGENLNDSVLTNLLIELNSFNAKASKKLKIENKKNSKNLPVQNVRLYFENLSYDYSHLFHYCTSLQSINFNNFNTELCENMEFMFSDCYLLSELNVSNFNISCVKNMSFMFNNCKNLTKIDFNEGTKLINTEKNENFSFIFSNCENLTYLNLRHFSFKNAKTLEGMFNKCKKLKKIDCKFNTENVVSLAYMFQGCREIENINLEGFITKNVKNMKYMFNECVSLKNIDVGNFDTNNVVYMNGMFQQCEKISFIDVCKFDVKNVEDLSYMFNQCKTLNKVNLFQSNSNKLNNISFMFANCISLSEVDLSKINTLGIQNMEGLFTNDTKLNNIKMGSSINNLRNLNFIFDNMSDKGTFTYDSINNYYKIIKELPKNWEIQALQF